MEAAIYYVKITSPVPGSVMELSIFSESLRVPALLTWLDIGPATPKYDVRNVLVFSSFDQLVGTAFELDILRIGRGESQSNISCF